MEAASTVGLRPAWPRRLVWFHPEWPWVVVVLLAWILLIGQISHGASEPGIAASDHAGHHSTADLHGASEVRFNQHRLLELTLPGLATWLLMVVAMMVPAMLPMLRRVSLGSLWNRRCRSAALVLAAYLALWLGFGAVAVAAWAAFEPDLPPAVDSGSEVATGALLFLAASWQLTRAHRRCVKRAHRELPLAPRGRKADASCLRFGLYHAAQCTGICWPVMLAMVPSHSLAIMASATVIVCWERLARVPSWRFSTVPLGALASAAVIAGL